MKILYLVHQYYPVHYTGTEKFVLNMSSMMQKWGHKVKVLTYSFLEDSFFDGSIEDILVRELPYQGIPVIYLKNRVMPDGLHYYLENEDLARVAGTILERENPDIIHVGHPMRITELIRASKLRGIPYLITLTDFWFLCPKGILFDYKNTLCPGPENGKKCRKLCPEYPRNVISRRLELSKDVLYGSGKVISPSKFLSDVFASVFPGLEAKVINHGLSYRHIEKQKKIYDRDSRLTFFYGGSLNYHKGVHVLVNAFRKIRAHDIALKIYGSGDPLYTEKLKELAGGDGRIEFRGTFSEERVGEILSGVDVAVIPSLWFENYPLILHEALACNVPVLASNVGGMAEKIKDGVNGFTFRIGDHSHLKERLETVIQEPAILNGLKKNINNIYIPTIEQEAYAYEREYRSLLNSAKTGVAGNK